MIDVPPRSRGIPRPIPIRAARPTLDVLEGRVLLYTTTGGSWTYPIQVSYSIVPDGTSIGGTPSNLQRVLSTKAAWQQQIQKAAATWEAVAGINLVQVPDDGSPIGTAGYQQDDPRFGDIRIGGMTQAGGQLGFAYAPPPFNGGTNAGDLFFNTSQSWQTNGQTYDLLTVAIHEFGHALGMGHSTIATAVMYGAYTSARQTLNPDDTAGIQSIYGARKPDAYDAAASNNSSKGATDITSSVDGSGQVALRNLDITTGNDVDWYKVTAPTSTTGTMTVAMQSSNLSSLIPGVSVYSANLQLAGGSTGSSYGSTISVSTQGIKPGQVWFIKAMANDTGPGGIGAYGLLVNFGSNSQSPIAAPDTAEAAQPDQNPTTTPLGTGWMINGRYLPFSGDIQGERGMQGKPGNDNGIGRITIGSLVGYGDQLEVGHLRGHGDGAGGGPDASGRHHPGELQRRWVAPALDGMPAASPTPPTIVIGVHPRRAWAGATSHQVRVASGRAQAAPVQAVDSALESWRSNGSLAMRPFPSHPEDGNHPRGHRTTAHTIGDSPP